MAPEQDEPEACEAEGDGPQTADTQRLKVSKVRGDSCLTDRIRQMFQLVDHCESLSDADQSSSGGDIIIWAAC